MQKLARFAASLMTISVMLLVCPAQAQEITPLDASNRFLIDSALSIFAGLSAILFIVAYGLRDIGLARVQNAPAACLRMLASFAVTVFAFWLSGYMLAFSVEEAGFLGEFASWRADDTDPLANGRSAGAAWFFQTGLAAMTAAIVAASVSERVRLWAFLIFVGFLAGMIYPIAISWVWGGGYFVADWAYKDGGGATVHIVAGAAALAAAFVVGPRPGRFNAKSPWIAATTMLPLSVFGAGLAWIALIGIFAGMGETLSSVEDAIRFGGAIVNISVATAAAVLTALVLTQFVYDRPGLVTTMCAVVAGPVTIAGDPVSPDLWQAAMIGAVGGVIVSVTPPFLARFRIDDAGFVVPTHLFCGVWGAMIVAWVNPDARFLNQALGAVSIALFSFGVSLMIWTALKYSPFGARQRQRKPPEDAVQRTTA